MKSECIDFQTLPGQNELFLAYLEEDEAVARFYPPSPLSPDEVDRRAEKVLNSQHLSRSVLMSVLRKLNSNLSGHEAISRNLDKLESNDTLAVLTGQQVGLFGGPCYSVYKAASAVQVAAFLESKGYSAVPIFWLASDDSDFEEVRSVWFFDDEGGLTSLRHPDKRSRSRQMAGTVSVDSATLAEFQKHLRGQQGPEGIVDAIGASYGSGKSFFSGYADWLTRLFGKYGLLLFDPLSAGYRAYLKDFLKIAVDQREELVSAGQKRGDDLRDAGLPVQVRLEESESFLFLVDPPHRFKLEFRNGYYEAKGRRSFRLDRTELWRQIEMDEITVGVNVLIRPVLQEYLFPTFGSVTGPAEIAYLAQVNSLSPFWGQEVAAISRAAFTIVDRKTQRLLRKYDLRAEQVLNLGSLRLAEEVLREKQGGTVLEELDVMKTRLSEQLQHLKEKLAVEDQTASQLLEGASRKMHYQLERVRRRFVLNRSSGENFRKGHLAYLGNHLFPRNRLQERVVNFNSFLATEGLGLVDEIVSKTDPEKVSHQFLYL